MPQKPGQGQDSSQREINAVFEERIADFRKRLTNAAEENYSSSGRKDGPNSEDVEKAYKLLTTPDKRLRPLAEESITIAFKENRFIQMAGYGMALVLFGFGIFLLGYSAFGPTDAVGRVASLVGGSSAQILLLIPLRFAVTARRNNLAIRILGYLLDRVDDPRLLAELVRRLIDEVTSTRSDRSRGRK